MKKALLILTALVMCISMAACGGDDAETTASEETKVEETKPEHVHTSKGGWERDAKGHWQICECGEKFNAGEHKLGLKDICKKCESEIFTYDDGSCYITDYDENENPVRSSSYDEKGEMTYDCKCVWAKDKNGDYYPLEDTAYDYEEKTIVVTKYDENWYTVTIDTTDFDGKVIEVQRYEREYNADNRLLWEKLYVNDVLTWEVKDIEYIVEDGVVVNTISGTEISYYDDGTKVVSNYDNRGELSKETYYKADGTVEKVMTYEYDYDADGYVIAYRAFEDGGIVTEETYEWLDDGATYILTSTEYNKDGSKTVFEYDENFELISETKYDKNGNVIK